MQWNPEVFAEESGELTPCASFLKWDFAFGDQGEIPVQERGRLMFPVRIITKASSKNSTMEPVSSA